MHVRSSILWASPRPMLLIFWSLILLSVTIFLVLNLFQYPVTSSGRERISTTIRARDFELLRSSTVYLKVDDLKKLLIFKYSFLHKLLHTALFLREAAHTARNPINDCLPKDCLGYNSSKTTKIHATVSTKSIQQI